MAPHLICTYVASARRDEFGKKETSGNDTVEGSSQAKGGASSKGKPCFNAGWTMIHLLDPPTCPLTRSEVSCPMRGRRLLKDDLRAEQ